MGQHAVKKFMTDEHVDVIHEKLSRHIDCTFLVDMSSFYVLLILPFSFFKITRLVKEFSYIQYDFYLSE